MSKNYFEYPTKAVEADKNFKHVMAITLDPRTQYRDGIIRCITNRSGELGIRGNVDRSVLHKVHGESLEHFDIGERLHIKGEEELIAKLGGPDWDFIGLEDPDIWIDEKNNLMHVYFTLPFLHKTKERTSMIGLGHAMGRDLDSLEMTEPTLFNAPDNAKEVSIAPVKSNGVRLNLIESKDRFSDVHYSTVRIVVAEDMGKPWKFGETVFNPKETKLSWIAGHASPGPLFPKTFIDIGDGKRVGIMNGREANKEIDGKTIYGIFSVGLFIYDYENGKIDWVSPKPFIKDSEAKIITFASQFVETESGRGILYAHVDDSFVRAYALEAEKIKLLLPPNII